MDHLFMLAQRGANSPINKWLNENPLILGLIAIMIGIMLAGSGAYELRKGVTHDKYGIEIKGGLGRMTSILRIVMGVAACGFGVYKMIAG